MKSQNTIKKTFLLLFIFFLIAFNAIALENEEKVIGIGILTEIAGMWNGPVFSDTPAGSFDTWYVDFRPVSAGQVSQYSTLDADTLNYTSFFIVKHDDQLKVALRTEGVFQNKGCVTYEVIDRVNESERYYRFSDFQAGTKRAYTEFTFKDEELLMEVYTNKFNRVSPLELHSRWVARRGGVRAAQTAASRLQFPQSVMIKDFTDVFENMFESIYFTFENVHPGRYYIYSYNDINGDRKHLRGDHMSSNIHNTFTLAPERHVSVDTLIDFIIP